MKKIFGLAFLFTFLSAAPVFAWPACNGNWVGVPSGTSGTSSSGYGAVVTENGQTFECEPNTLTSPPSTPTTITNTNSNQNTNSSSSQSTSKSNSKSNSISSATGGNASATGGSVSNSGNSNNEIRNNIRNTVSTSATGGSVKNSGNSSISNSGNSQQSQKQSQSQSTTSSADNNGNGNGNNSNNTYVPRQTATATAPFVAPTTPCFKGVSGGGQGPTFGFSFGGGKIDDNCAVLETARVFGGFGSRLAYCKVMLTDKYVQKAHVTLADCMAEEPKEEPIAAPVPAPVAAPIIVNPPVITVNIPAPVVTTIPEPKPVPVPSVAEEARINRAAKKVHHYHKPPPCYNNDNIPQAH